MTHERSVRLPGPAFWWRATLLVLVRPRLWWTALRQALRLARPRWWASAPFVPVPDPDYLRITRAVSGHEANCRGEATGLLGRFWEQFQAARGPGSGAVDVLPEDHADDLERCVERVADEQ